MVHPLKITFSRSLLPRYLLEASSKRFGRACGCSQSLSWRPFSGPWANLTGVRASKIRFFFARSGVGTISRLQVTSGVLFGWSWSSSLVIWRQTSAFFSVSSESCFLSFGVRACPVLTALSWVPLSISRLREISGVHLGWLLTCCPKPASTSYKRLQAIFNPLPPLLPHKLCVHSETLQIGHQFICSLVCLPALSLFTLLFGLQCVLICLRYLATTRFEGCTLESAVAPARVDLASFSLRGPHKTFRPSP